MRVAPQVHLDRTDHAFVHIAQSHRMPGAVLGVHSDGCLSVWQRHAVTHAPVEPPQTRAAEHLPGLPDTASPADPARAAVPAVARAAPADVRVKFVFRSMGPLLKARTRADAQQRPWSVPFLPAWCPPVSCPDSRACSCFPLRLA